MTHSTNHESIDSILNGIDTRITSNIHKHNLDISSLEERIEERTALMKQTISILQESIQSVNGGERTIIDTKERNSNYSLEQQVEACSIVNGYAKSATLEVVEQEVYDHQTECYGRFVLRNRSVKTVERIEPFVWIPADEQPRQEWQPILSWHCTSDSIEPNAETILLVRLVRHSTKHQWGELALRWLLRCIPVDHAGECAIKDTTTPAIEWYVMPLSLDNT